MKKLIVEMPDEATMVAMATVAIEPDGTTVKLMVNSHVVNLWLKGELSYQRREQAYNEALYNIVIDRQLETINELKKKIEELEA